MKKGGLFSSLFFNLRILENPEKTTLFSVVVSKKIAKTAVLRNKIRRRAYSILKKSVKNPYFIILFAKKGVEKANFLDTKEVIQDILIKAKIL
jgi:ribonuclease P protein component